MKNLLSLSFALIIFTGNLSCMAQSSNKTKETSGAVKAYYFHFTARCITCKAVESEAKMDIENLYGNKVIFQSVNLDEDSGKALAEKLQVDGQTLLIVKGNAKINLTNEGFLYARTNPDKLKSIIKEKIDPLIN